MKKLLIAGAAAMTLSLTFVSCSHEVGEYDASTDLQQRYEDAFIELFGQPDPDQNWGFGPKTSIASARTRSNPGNTYPATHTYTDGGANTNANEWADPDKYYGGWLVPDPLTPGQKERVKAYFQANPNLSYDDPHIRHFFVQQVYKGATDAGSNSTEIVTAADGSQYTSDNMNHLTVGQSNMHINNFNAGTCSERSDIIKNGEKVGGATQTDQIMLMVNIDDTSCFGYHDSGSSNEANSINHNDRAALVSAQTIDNWAASHGNPGEAVVDKWNRSFLGFDLAIKEGNQIWSGETQSLISGLNMEYDGIYFGDDNIIRKVDVDPEHTVDEDHPYGNYDKKWPDNMDTVMKDADDNPLKILASNTNFYSGDLKTLDDSYFRIDNNGVLLNMEKINEELISKGYYPVSGSAFKTWVKPEHSYDNYYSDWIVTLTEAQRTKEPEPEEEVDFHADIRIIAEDLTFSETVDGRVAKTDFDFNDVVFDVMFNDDGTAWVQLIAAGGTLPLVIGGTDDLTGKEVHDLFGVQRNKMVNTNAKTGTSRPYPKPFKVSGTSTTDWGKNIPVYVQKNGVWTELTANQGQPAAKVGVDPGFVYCDERVAIEDDYPEFPNWVKDSSVKWY